MEDKEGQREKAEVQEAEQQGRASPLHGDLCGQGRTCPLSFRNIRKHTVPQSWVGEGPAVRQPREHSEVPAAEPLPT